MSGARAALPINHIRPTPQVRIDSVPVHDSFSINSRALGEARPVNVYTPPQYRTAKTTAFPVLYMPDGGLDEDFPHVVRTVDSLIARGAIRPVIIVGMPNTERRRDLTGPTHVRSDSAVAPRVGGSAAFRQFIHDELMPEIERRYRTTPERALMGESFAGLFVVETFLDAPDLFLHYIALDPSVWWSAGSLVASAGSRMLAFKTVPRTLFIASSREPTTATGSAQLAALLKRAPPHGLKWTYVPRPDLTHANIFRTLESSALVYVFGKRRAD